MNTQPDPFDHLTLTAKDSARAARREKVVSAVAPFVTRRLAGVWANGRYPDFRNGTVSPAEAAEDGDAGLGDVLAYITRIGPSLKGKDWSGSGWVGKGSKRRR